VVAPGDLVGQAQRTVENLLAALATQAWLRTRCSRRPSTSSRRSAPDLVRVWDVVSERLGRVPSTLLGVSCLGYPGQLVEIEAVAAAGI
jgi:enamine deaminase RidA (YjgF/YER057c/UK114 family)